MRNVIRNVDSMRFDPVPMDTSPIREYGTGRVCGDGSCSALLSRYNKGPNCFLHTPKETVSSTGRPVKPGRKRKGLCPKHGVVHYTKVRHIV